MSYHLHRLWAGAVPILRADLIKSGTVAGEFNDALTSAAVSAFDAYTNTASSSTLSNEGGGDGSPSSIRRRRRARPSNAKRDDPASSLSMASHRGSASSEPAVTPNDNFFEFQRTRGYRLATPSISSCGAALQLEERHIIDATIHYLQYVGKSSAGRRGCNQSGGTLAESIANKLQKSGAGLSIDLWAAVQRGGGAYHADHVHEGAIVSGVYYSNCPVGCAPLVLRKPDDAKQGEQFQSDAGSPDQEDVVIQPAEGQMVLFPPWLLHGVPMVNQHQQSDLPRVSWAFNLTARLASIGDPWSVTQC